MQESAVLPPSEW